MSITSRRGEPLFVVAQSPQLKASRVSERRRDLLRGLQITPAEGIPPKPSEVEVQDLCRDGWVIEVEVWWTGHLRRTCWDVTGRGAHSCEFNIPPGTDVTLYIAEASRWVSGRRARGGNTFRYPQGGRVKTGCKRIDWWAGPWNFNA